jgi:hypothetical protein
MKKFLLNNNWWFYFILTYLITQDPDWSGVSGNQHYNFAWGHGGQIIAVIQAMNMVVVATAAPQAGFDNVSWQKGKAVMELVGRFIEQI